MPEKNEIVINTGPLISIVAATGDLDIGEASVIQLALNKNIQTVCIDEKVGRRVARLYNLSLTGSIGILIKAKNYGYLSSMKNAISEMKNKGIYLSDNIIEFALKHTNEI